MISLFLNTSSNYLNIAVLENNKVLKEKNIKLDKTLSKMALPCIKELIEATNLKPIDIDEIVCVEGPGSFTGLRVGVTIAKTYAWTLNKKLCGISTLFAMATSIEDEYIIPIIDARRNYVFAGIYDKNYNIIMEDVYINIDDLQKKVKALDKSYTYVTNDEFDFKTVKYEPNLNNLFKYLKKEYVDYHAFVPKYLKATEAEENLNK